VGGTWAQRVRSVFGVPADLLERTRLLFLALGLGTGMALLGQFAFGGRPDPDRIAGALILGALLMAWVWAFRRRAYPRLIDPLVALGLVLLAVAIGDVEPVLGLFLSIFFRSLYGSGPHVAVSVAFYVAALLAIYVLRPSFDLHARPGDAWLTPFLSLAPVPVVLAVIARFLKRTIEGQARLERQLRRNEVRFRSLVHNSSDVVVILDRQDQIQYHTPSTEQLLGYEDRDLVGRLLASILHPDDRVAVATFLKSAAALDSASMEWRLLHANGHWLQVEALSNGILEDGARGGLVLTMRDVTERKAFEERLTHQEGHDALTDLPNRLLFSERLDQLRARGMNGADCVGVLFIDIDDFKVVNDTLGHAVGDQLLVAVGMRLAGIMRRGDLVACLGGDDFAVLTLMRSTNEAELLALRLAGAFAAPFDIAGNALTVRVSIGIATDGRNSDSSDTIMSNADVAMYSAKAHGKSRFVTYEAGMGRAIQQRATIELELAAALELEQLVVHYQPIVDLGSGETVGGEALVRWEHPLRGLVPPLEFIPIAEQTGLIVPLGRSVLRMACEQGRAWQVAHRRTDGQPLSVTVNVSVQQLLDTDFVPQVAAILTETGFDPTCLVLEVTESLFLKDRAVVRARLEALRALGAQIALDDFGTGFSSLSYLHEFPIDLIKIDYSFVRGIGVDEKKSTLVRSLAVLGKSLGVRTIAEGVETDAQCAAVKEYGYDYAQGYLFARPLAAAAFTAALRAPPADCVLEDGASDDGQAAPALRDRSPLEVS